MRAAILIVWCSLLCWTCSARSIFGSIFGVKARRGKQHRKIVIVGSGPAGATAAIYASRAMLQPLQIAGYNYGGQLMLTSDVENFPGYRTAVSGPDIIEDLTHQAAQFGTETWQTDVIKVDFNKRPFELTTHNCTVTADCIIISTGANSVWLGADGEDEFKGKGISTCATCDGYLFRDETVVVIGGGDSAMEEANFLSRFAKEVIVIHRSEKYKASKIMLERTKGNPKVRFMSNAVVDRWLGAESVLTGLVYKDLKTGSLHELKCRGAFIAIGHRPNTGFLGQQVMLDENGYIVLSKHTMTSVPGVFACGDVADTRYRQAITAAGTGCQAAMDAERWLEEQGK